MPPVTLRQVALVRRFANSEVARTERGRQWLALLRAHWPEVIRLLATDAALREQAARALAAAAQLIERQRIPHHDLVDKRSITVAERVLARLDARASAPFRDAIAGLRRDLRATRGRSLADVLGNRS